MMRLLGSSLTNNAQGLITYQFIWRHNSKMHSVLTIFPSHVEKLFNNYHSREEKNIYPSSISCGDSVCLIAGVFHFFSPRIRYYTIVQIGEIVFQVLEERVHR